MPEPTGEPTGEPTEVSQIGMPPGMTQEDHDRIIASMAPKEPIVDKAAQAIARQKLIDSQTQLAKASAEAVEGARTANEASTPGQV